MLTGLPNRTLLNDRLALVLSLAKRHKHKPALMMMDMDKFKYINDTFGHLTGDELLKAMGNRLLNLLRVSDTVARIGGDEFVILLPEINSENNAAEIADKILESIRKPFILNDKTLNITTSIGIALYPDSGKDSIELLKNADKALYKAKEKGRNRYFIFSE
jgi:diguanylate cyclase (GGDEF)-like protein